MSYWVRFVYMYSSITVVCMNDTQKSGTAAQQPPPEHAPIIGDHRAFLPTTDVVQSFVTCTKTPHQPLYQYVSCCRSEGRHQRLFLQQFLSTLVCMINLMQFCFGGGPTIAEDGTAPGLRPPREISRTFTGSLTSCYNVCPSRKSIPILTNWL